MQSLLGFADCDTPVFTSSYHLERVCPLSGANTHLLSVLTGGLTSYISGGTELREDISGAPCTYFHNPKGRNLCFCSARNLQKGLYVGPQCHYEETEAQGGDMIYSNLSGEQRVKST